VSYDLIVYGPSSTASTRQAWQVALDATSAGIDLPAGVDPARWTGGLVALGPGSPPPGFLLERRGLDPGEIDPARTGAQPPEIANLLSAATTAYDLSAPFTGGAGSWNALWLAAGALAAALDGVLRDPQANTFTAGPAAPAAARQAVAVGSTAAAAAVVSTPWGPLPRAEAEARARAENRAPFGLFTVTLVEASGNHPALVRTVGRALGAGDGRARSALRDLPLVLVEHVSRTYGDDLVSRLAGFGARAVVG
jgi:ribosomal protein L7/L12